MTFRHNVALVSAATAMTEYFNAFGPHTARMRSEAGMPGAIAGIFKAPFDIIGDKLRGFIGLTMDMYTQPDKVLKACEALMPHLYWLAAATADPESQLPIGYWMHRGCVPFVRPDQFASHYWPTVKPLIEELWRNGHQTMFYAEGNWDAHLAAFRELPDRSIVYHIDRGTPLLTHRTLHDKFALSGGVSNVTLALGTPEQVRQEVKTLIETVGREGGFMIEDASAIMQNNTTPENMRALVNATHEFGGYNAPDVPRAAARRAGRDHHDCGRAGDNRTSAGRVRLVGRAPGRAGRAHPGQRGAGQARLGGGGRQGVHVHLADARLVLTSRRSGGRHDCPPGADQATTADAAAYTRYIESTGIAEYAATPGNLGASMLLRDRADGTTEVVTLSFWTTMEAIKGFAGPDPGQAVFYPEDDRYLVERETTVTHWDVPVHLPAGCDRAGS